MKKILLTSAIVLMTAGAANAVTPYTSVKLGYMYNAIEAFESGTLTDISKKFYGFDGFVGSVAGGIAWQAEPFLGLRGELEYSHAKTKLKLLDEKMTLDANSVMINGYTDLGDESWKIKPYVGFGAGYSFGSVLIDDDSINGKGGFVYAGIIGITYAFDSSFTVDISAKSWVNNDKVSIDGDSLDTKYSGTSFMLGLRYSF